MCRISCFHRFSNTYSALCDGRQRWACCWVPRLRCHKPSRYSPPPRSSAWWHRVVVHASAAISSVCTYTARSKPATGLTGPLANGAGFHQHEELGVANTNGVDTTGYRETNTINAGVLGNDRPMVTTREFWYSARLGINLISKVDDPQSGKQVFTSIDVTTSEPDPALLAVPGDFRIVDHSKEKDVP